MSIGDQPDFDSRITPELRSLAKKILDRNPIGIDDIIHSGLSGQLTVSLVESLIWASLSTEDEVESFMSNIFGQFEDIIGYLEGLKNENIHSLEKFLSSGVLERLAVGEISTPRLSQASSLSPRQAIIFALSAVLHNKCTVIRRCPATWRSATQAITSGEDRNGIIQQFLDELGLDSRSRMLLLLYVWSGGDTEIVEAGLSLVGTDDYDIVEAALSIDGISDFPAYEVVGAPQCLSINTAPAAVKVPIFLSLLARAFELAAERVEADPTSEPHIVSLNLKGDFYRILSSLNWALDPNFCDTHVKPSSDEVIAVGAVTELDMEVKLRAGMFTVQVSEITDQTATISLIRTTPSTSSRSSSFQIWSVDSLVGIDGRVASKEAKEDGFVFTLSRVSALAHEEQVLVNPSKPDEVRLTISWTVPFALIDKTWPAPMLPTEIHLPPVIPAGDHLLRTIPLIPQARLVLVIQDVPLLNGMGSRSSDLVTCIDANSSTRDLVREISANDVIVVSEKLLDSHQFVAGLIVGSGKTIYLISDSVHTSVLGQSLIQQGFARPWSFNHQ